MSGAARGEALERMIRLSPTSPIPISHRHTDILTLERKCRSMRATRAGCGCSELQGLGAHLSELPGMTRSSRILQSAAAIDQIKVVDRADGRAFLVCTIRRRTITVVAI